jgi:branched-chain amino acid transport system substrate-binding protein
MIRIVLALLALLVLDAPASATEPYTIDVILSSTGPGAFSGKLAAQALQLYEAVTNKTGGIHGRPLHFEIVDDTSSPQVAVQLINQMLTKHPIVILGPNNTASCAAVAPLITNATVDYCLSPAINAPPGSFVFSASATLEASQDALFDRLRDLGYKRAAVIVGTDAIGNLNQAVTRKYFASPEHKALALVSNEVFNPADPSVAAQVSRIKAAGPDVIINFASGTPFGTVLRDVSNSGLDVLMATSPVNANPAQLIPFAPFMPKALVVPGVPFQGRSMSAPLQAAANEYLNATKEAGIEPNPSHAFSWDPARILVYALRALPADASASQLHDSIEKLHDFAGLFGMYDFRSGDQHGISGLDFPLVRWDGVTKTWSPFDSRSH